MQAQGTTAPSGTLGLTLIRGGVAPRPVPPSSTWPARPATVRDIIEYGCPAVGLPENINRWRRSNLRNLWRGARRILAARRLGVPHIYGQLWLTVYRGDGTVEDLGLASMRVVTDAGVAYIATRLVDGNTSIGAFDFHGFGTGGAAEAVGNTTLTTEETTQYVADVRPTGTPTKPTAPVYRNVGTYSPDSGTNPRPITEHGLFSANAAGTLLDRSLFSVVNLVPSSDSLQATYDFTIASGG